MAQFPIHEKIPFVCHTSVAPEEATKGTFAYPRFLLETNLSDSARLVYLLLLDRARASMMNPGWEDENGRVFVFYPIEDLAADTHRSQTVVKKALADLQRQGLIRRCRQGLGKANKLFVCIPDRQSENRPSDGRKTDHQTVGIPTGNKNNQTVGKPTIRRTENRPSDSRNSDRK